MLCSQCEVRGWWETLCWESGASFRLVGGSRCSGRVEVLHGETWSTVCDADFDQQDAEVVCRELGCGPPVEVDAHFGPGSGPIWMDDVYCVGSESTLKHCTSPGWGKHDCDHSKDAGVICSGKFIPLFSFFLLVDGGSRCTGRVEVLNRGQWGTVCDDNWDLSDAAVVCRELGCGEAVDALSDAYFGPGSGPIWMDDVDCSGSESTLKKCQLTGLVKHTCNHTKDAGVICSVYMFFFLSPNILDVRLINSSRCSGRVEVLHRQTWSTVCDADFDQQDAEVVCRELGCGLPVEVLGAAAFGRGEGQVWSEELQCRGNESQIHFCPTSSSLKYNCSHYSDVGLVCAGTSKEVIGKQAKGSETIRHVRLVDGGIHCAGRVEVLHRGQWGTVCGHGWDMRDAAVVCRELRCGEAVDALSKTPFGPGSGPIWMDNVDCSGSESTLKNCGSKGWGKHNCDHSSDSGVICSGKLYKPSKGFEFLSHSLCPLIIIIINYTLHYL
uniref:SRCR domain-containing protein n=1 Tax=Pygocentrus nattereri TaxID=42514 RepID=A0A3B4EH83_PYGNA